MPRTGIRPLPAAPSDDAPPMPGVIPSDPANRRRLSAPAIRTFVAISDLWGLNEAHRLRILGSPSRSAYQSWTKAVREHEEIMLGVDVLTRISAVLGIHSALGILEQDEASGIAWLRRPHGALSFGGQPPMDLVAGGTLDGLMVVRRFLDAARGGQYMAPNGVDRGVSTYRDEDVVFT